MPNVDLQGIRILVTGANGYIGMWVVQLLLEQGSTVRAVVRSMDKGKIIKKYFESYGDKLEFFCVEDITKEGAFDDAVKDVDAIEHIASPATFAFDDPDVYIKPAVAGTVGILESARKFGGQIRRIVITSSVAAIYDTVTRPSGTFDENSWNDAAIAEVKIKGKEAVGQIKYSASKTLAEHAAWDLHARYRDEIKWDLVVIHPSFVWGPALQEARKPEDLPVSLQILWNAITKEVPESELTNTCNLVHVKDVAAAHLIALTEPEAGNQRFILSAEATTWQGIRELACRVRPDLYTSGILYRGTIEPGGKVTYICEGEKSRKLLGLTYATPETIIRDALEDFEAKGLFNKQVKEQS